MELLTSTTAVSPVEPNDPLPVDTNLFCPPAPSSTLDWSTAEAHGYKRSKYWAKHEPTGKLGPGGTPEKGKYVDAIAGLSLPKLAEFVEGERLRTGASFHKQGQTSGKGDASRSNDLGGIGELAAKPFDYAVFRCANWGDPKVKKEEDRLRHLGERALQGTGCPARFSTKLQKDGTYSVNYLHADHGEACRIMCEGGPLRRSRPANEMLRTLVFNNPGMRTDQLIREYMRQYVYTAMMEEGFESEDAVLDHWTLHPEEAPPDAIVTEKDISNYRQQAAAALWRLAADDAESVELWVQGHKDIVIHYQRQDVTTGQPFILVFTTKDLIEMLKKYGNKATVHLDDTFGAHPSPSAAVVALPRGGRRNGSQVQSGRHQSPLPPPVPVFSVLQA